MAKVFISCGQSSPSERLVAKDIHKWFSENGYNPYVAVETQNLSDVNSGIIKELRSSDYYVFIDFKRGDLKDGKYRGSLFTNQELAIAHTLGFEEAIFLKNSEVMLEGISQYMTANAVHFNNENEVIGKLEELVAKHEWKNTYSRHLVLGSLDLSGPCSYKDHTGQTACKILTAKIMNKRSDIAAYNTVVRLERIECNGEKVKSHDRNLLKVSGQIGYDQTIWPESYGEIDLLLISFGNPICIYLNSLSDVYPRKPIISNYGNYTLYYSLIAESFPIFNFSINIYFDDNIDSFTYEIK